MSSSSKGRIVAIMLGRKGSIGFPGKNTYKIMGRSVLEYPLLASKHSKWVDNVYVTTDDESIKRIARHYDAEIIDRPPELCTPETLFEDALLHGYHEIKKRENTPIKYIITLMCNAAAITSKLIDEAIEKLESCKEADSAVTVSSYNMWSPLRARKVDTNGFMVPFVPFEVFGDPKTLNCDRDSQGDVYFADMCLSVSRSECLENFNEGLLPQRWMGKKILPVHNWAGCDIDFEWQVPPTEFWLRKNGFSDTITPYDCIKIT